MSMKFLSRSRYYAWKRRRVARALSRIDRKCLKMRTSLLYSSSHSDHAQNITPTAQGKTNYLSFWNERPHLGYPIRSYLTTQPGTQFELRGGPTGAFSWDDDIQYYGKKEQHMQHVFTNKDGTWQDEFGAPVKVMPYKPKPPAELISITGYGPDGQLIWDAELVVRRGTDNREQWISTNDKLGSFMVHHDAEQAVKYHLDPNFANKTYSIGARSKDGRYNTVFMSNLLPGKKAELAYAELIRNG